MVCMVRAVQKFYFIFVTEEKPNKWRPVQRSCRDTDSCFLHDLHVPPPAIIASVRGLYPRCEGQLHSLEKRTVQRNHRFCDMYCIHPQNSRLQLKCDGTRWRTGGEVKGNLANGVGGQYPSHYLGTWCIQHYYRWCAHLGYQQSTELTPPAPISMDSSVSPKDEIWFLRVCHHISKAVYIHNNQYGVMPH